MDRKQKLATAGAISLTATAAVVALGASVGLFGLTDDSPKVGKLSPIDSTQTTTSTTPDDVQTIIVDDTGPGTPSTTSNTSPSTSPNTTSNTTPNPTSNTIGNPPTTSNTLPDGDDHGGDDNSGDDNSGPGSSSSGHGSGGDDSSGHGGSGRDHPEDD